MRSIAPVSGAVVTRVVAGAFAVALAAGVATAVQAAPASATTTTFNPFDVNNGFTIVSRGDAMLANGEIEGSIAVFGAISSGNPNGYPVIHQAAGESDYTVPTIDGEPVRILATSFSGSGSFDLSNRAPSGAIAPDSPEATATAKLVDTSNLTASGRGGGTVAGDFLRLTSADGGHLDLKTVPFEGAVPATTSTELDSVEAYFAGADAAVERANRCLAALYDATDLVNRPEVTGDQWMVTPTGFATDRPNVVDYADLVGRTIKLDRADGYVPTAEAPLVIRVAAGTTTLGALNFEGWSPQAGAQQDLARHILYDLSAVSGDVTIDGLALGAVWAPDSTLTFASGITTNGQWFANGVATSGGGEIHHHTFDAALPCVEDATTEPVDTTPATTTPAETTPAETTPATTTPAETTPAETTPATTTPAETTPATTTPAETTPATTTPAETTPAETTPAETTPATTTPAETTPAETTPVTTTPAETTPTITTPATSAPASTAPATSTSTATSAPGATTPATTAPAGTTGSTSGPDDGSLATTGGASALWLLVPIGILLGSGALLLAKRRAPRA